MGSLPAFHRDQGVSVFWINEIRSFNRFCPPSGHLRGWKNKDITSGCAPVAVKHRDTVIYPIRFEFLYSYPFVLLNSRSPSRMPIWRSIKCCTRVQLKIVNDIKDKPFPKLFKNMFEDDTFNNLYRTSIKFQTKERKDFWRIFNKKEKSEIREGNEVSMRANDFNILPKLNPVLSSTYAATSYLPR